MSRFFEQELRKLFEDGSIIESPRFPGNICLGALGRDLRVRAAFVSTYVANEYDALRVTVLNRTEGEVDKITLHLADILGKKMIPNNPNFRDGLAPHIWIYNGEVKWYGYRPTDADYQKLRQAVGDYLEVFRERETVRDADGPKLVYICAPLWGDVEKNIEFARQKAQEVFQAGDVPICPHLMFSLITDPKNPEQDQAAREMGLQMVESCQQVNVYGTTLTERMWAEVNHAIMLDIPVKSDLKAIQRGQSQRRAARKGKGAR